MKSVVALVTFAACAATLSLTSLASAQQVNFNRHPQRHSPAVKPAGVPAEYVVTRNGFFHPSCVITIDRDEVWGQDLVIRGLDGTARDTIAPCAYPRFSLTGRAMPAESARSARVEKPGAAMEPITSSDVGRKVSHNQSSGGYDGWVAFYDYAGSIPNGASLVTEWVVPLPPTNVKDQDIAFFNDFETTNIILQPVLDFSEIPGQWAIESENCCAAGNDVQSTLVQVSAGDVIKGTVTMADCSTSNVCTNWTVTTLDENTGKSTVLNMQNPKEAADEMNPAVLETYSITSCDMLPANGEVTFFNNVLTDSNGATVNKTYTLDTILSGDSQPPPSDFPMTCNYSGKSSGGQYTLVFSQTPTAITPDGGLPTGTDDDAGASDAGSGSSKDASISGNGSGNNGNGDNGSTDDVDSGSGSSGDNATTSTSAGCSFARGDAATGSGAFALAMGLLVLGGAARRRRNRKS